MKSFAGKKDVKLHDSFFELPFVKRVITNDQHRELFREVVIIGVHSDEVIRIPEGATVHASATGCDVECFTVGDNVLCI